MAFGMKSDKHEDQPDAAADTRETSEDAVATGEPGTGGGERPSFRPDFLEKDAPRTAPRTPSPAGVFFVSVAKPNGDEIHRFDDPMTTQTFVEQLLEQGVPPEDVATYSGRRLEFKVSHRPVVSLARE